MLFNVNNSIYESDDDIIINISFKDREPNELLYMFDDKYGGVISAMNSNIKDIVECIPFGVGRCICNLYVINDDYTMDFAALETALKNVVYIATARNSTIGIMSLNEIDYPNFENILYTILGRHYIMAKLYTKEVI